jgi:hypothetical protein
VVESAWLKGLVAPLGWQLEPGMLHTNYWDCCALAICRTTKKGYEEVHVPALKPKPYEDGECIDTAEVASSRIIGGRGRGSI